MGATDTPRERRAQRTHDAILEAARQIISREGIDALSIRSIADAIDYSPAGLYEYFGSKDEIILAVIQQGFEWFTQTLERVDVSLPPRDYLREVGLAYIDFAVRNPDFFLLMFTTAPLSSFYAEKQQAEKDVASAKAALKEQPSFAVLYRAVERCVEEGLFQTPPGYGTFEMALTAWNHVHGSAMLRVTNFRHIPADFTAIDRAGLDILYRGFSSKEIM